MSTAPTAAYRLQGLSLNDKWEVLGIAPRIATQTGSCFSVGYIVADGEGRHAFLKALNFEAALNSTDPARAIASMAEQFNFERDILEFCRGNRMSRVVRAVDHGVLKLGDSPADIVQFIVFEPADGDLRKLIAGFSSIDEAWAVTIAHQVSVGLGQLHGRGIAHQDLKPSNVLSFGGAQNAKVADLGCASRSGTRSPRDAHQIPGARPYAAPELIYGRIDPDWSVRRLAPDLYQLGSLICFLFTGQFMLPTLLKHVPTQFRPPFFGGTFQGRFADVQPFVREAYLRALEEVSTHFSTEVGRGVFGVMKVLCDPDPLGRTAGGPKWSGNQQHSIVPFVSQLANLAARARYGARHSIRDVQGDYAAQ